MSTNSCAFAGSSESLTAIEAELLTACSRVDLTTEKVARIREIITGGQIDWERVQNISLQHCVTQLLYRSLKASCENVVPAETMRRLRAAYEYGAQRNLALAADLKKLLRAMAMRDIPCVPFKGPTLACDVYTNLGLRLFGDLDILVRERDIAKAVRVLNEFGYAHEYQLRPAEEAAYIRFEHAFHFVHRTNGRVVELHWRLSHRDLSFEIDGHGLWSRLRTGKFLGTTTLSLDDSDLFLYLCMHGTKHAWDRLEWICSISETINRSTYLNWDVIAARAKKMGGLRMYSLALRLAAEVVGNEHARALLRKIPNDPIAATLAAQVRDRLFVPKMEHPQHEVHRRVFYLQARERLSDRIRGVVYSCVRTPHPVSNDVKVYRLPSWLVFLYYLLRPVRLAREYGVSWLRAVLRPSPLA